MLLVYELCYADVPLTVRASSSLLDSCPLGWILPVLAVAETMCDRKIIQNHCTTVHSTPWLRILNISSFLIHLRKGLLRCILMLLPANTFVLLVLVLDLHILVKIGPLQILSHLGRQLPMRCPPFLVCALGTWATHGHRSTQGVWRLINSCAPPPLAFFIGNGQKIASIPYRIKRLIIKEKETFDD